MPDGGGEPRGAKDVEAEYFQSVEEFFVERRGDPLFLSNADWTLARRWRKQGIPLRIVLRGIADALDAHAHSWSRDRKVGSLAYCAGEVDAAADRWRRALATGQSSTPAPREHLSRIAEVLLRVSGELRGAAARGVQNVGEALLLRASEPGEVGTLEPWLAGLELRLVRTLARCATEPAEVARIEAAVDADLVPYRERMPRAVLDQVRQEGIARQVLERHGLPRLSLFHADRE
jgi:hypothetical protein